MNAYSAGYNVGATVGQQLILWIISLIVNIVLYTAANNIQKALASTDQRLFRLGLSQLARYFKIIGIAFIVAICLVVVIFIGVLLFSSFRFR